MWLLQVNKLPLVAAEVPMAPMSRRSHGAGRNLARVPAAALQRRERLAKWKWQLSRAARLSFPRTIERRSSRRNFIAGATATCVRPNEARGTK